MDYIFFSCNVIVGKVIVGKDSDKESFHLTIAENNNDEN